MTCPICKKRIKVDAKTTLHFNLKDDSFSTADFCVCPDCGILIAVKELNIKNIFEV